jgi:hypothetical protein
MRYFLIAFLSIYFWETSSAQAEEVFRLNLRHEAVDENYRKTQAIIPVFKYTGQAFEGIAEFGLKTSKKNIPETFEIKFPKISETSDTSYTYLFFGANKNKTPVGYVFCIIENNVRWSEKTLFWIDRNMNLDFTDDGPPDTFYNKSSNPYLHIKLYHPELINAFHLIQLTRFDLSQNIQYKKLLNEHYQKNSGNKVFAGADYSFREQRLNLKSSDFKIGTDSFRIAIRDENCNGIFNEKEHEKILIGEYKQEELSEIVFEADKEGFYFEWNFKKYRITKIDPAGSYLEFYYDSISTPDRKLKIGKKLPKIKVVNVNPEISPKKLRKYKGKPLFIYFFNLNSENFKEDVLYLSKIHEEFGDRIKVLAINYGDPPRKVFGWVNINKIPFETAVASQKILKKYHVYQLPTTLLTNKKLRLCQININSQEFYKHLKENN